VRIAEIMTDNVLTIGSGASIEAARELMRRRSVRHLVVKESGAVVGVVSDRDLSGAGARRMVDEVMARRVVTASSRDTVRSAANRMRGRTIGCLPVIDRGRLVGIVTVSDLLQLIGRGADRPAPGERAALFHRVPHRKRTRRSASW
jgi:CBS domain-containing protein